VTDEVYSALTAHTVAATGRDPHGAFLPLYFQMDLPKHGSPMWFQPALMYAMVLALKVLPFSESTIRLPMAIAGVANVVLMYFVGRALFGRGLFAVGAAVLLALTPAHFMYSRVAMDFQAPLPFILAWLLCLLTYLKRGDRRLLFAGGAILGAGVYSYVAAAAFMPLYLLLTAAVLLTRRESARSFAALGAGFILPLLLAIPALARNPTMLRDVALHYAPDDAPAAADAASSIGSLVAPARFADAATLYAGFWNPRFLFVDGPLRTTDATWQVGVFLLPVAGLLLLGLARAIRRPMAPLTLVLAAGVLTAPIPASFAQQSEAIRRALELLPFAVLVGVVGLESLWTDRSAMTRGIAFVAFWSVVIALAIASHDHVPRAQAYVRASTVPLGIAALLAVLDRFPIERLTLRTAAIPAVATMIACQAAYFLGLAWMVMPAIAVVFIAAWLLRSEPDGGGNRLRAIVVLLAAIASEFTFLYVDYASARIGPVPASAIVMTMRLGAASAVLLASFAAATIVRALLARFADDTVVAFAIVGVAYVQVAYFFVDWFANPWLRFLQVATIFVAAVKIAALSQQNTKRALQLGPLTAVGILGLLCLQFGFFYADYFTEFQARGSGTAVGSVRLAFESAVGDERGRPVPAIYLARVRNESPGLGAMYATFYLTKLKREDLIDATVEGDQYMGFEVDRVNSLPPGSLVIVNPSARNERVIDELTARGELTRDRLLKTPDGTPMFWILRKPGR